jgi:hypothetical protein
MPSARKAVANGRERLICDACAHEELIVEYGPLQKPKKGGKEKGFFGKCAKCGKEHHISYGYSN